jgi:hypothetical protein
MLCVAILLRVVQMSSIPVIPRHEPPILHAAKPQWAPPFPGRGRRTPHRTGAGSSAYPADETSPGPP